MINGDDFPPLSGSKVLNGDKKQGESSRVSASRDSPTPSFSSDLQGDSRAKSPGSGSGAVRSSLNMAPDAAVPGLSRVSVDDSAGLSPAGTASNW